MMASPALSVTSCDQDMNEEVRKLGYSTVPTAFPFSGPSRDDLRDRLDKEFRVPQSIFIAEGIKLRALKPVAITISRGQDLWFAENERLDIYATGESKETAIQEFKLLLVRFYNHYKSLDANLALKRAKELKKLFQERFVEVEQ
jgi:hypothetical protein